MTMVGRFVAHLVVNAFALWLAAQVISGVHFDGSLLSLAVLALIFGIVNTLIKPLVSLLTLPLTVVTLGLFALVINALMLLLTSALDTSYSIDGFIPALLASILISIVSTLLNWFIKDSSSTHRH
jgi:putative membrane protein